MQRKGNSIEWKHLFRLYYSDAGADRVCPGLRMATKLKREHLYLTSFSKMRVDLAAQVCNLYFTIYIISNMQNMHVGPE